MPTYTPKPLDTRNVELPALLNALLEQLAENTHEVGAVQRIKDGWTLGPERDDPNKKHPCLVKYWEIPESDE
jgi:hypothetical protein